MSPDVAHEARRWLRYAREDLTTARGLVGTPDAPPRHPAWLAQQAAEKAVKAVLVALQISFPFVHDIERLVELVPAGWVVHDVGVSFAALTAFAVEARYPDDFPDVSGSEAASGVVDAGRIVEAVEADLVPLLDGGRPAPGDVTTA